MNTLTTTLTPDQLQTIQRLTRDLARGSGTLDRAEARFLVSNYYRMQDNRIRAAAQLRSLDKTETTHDTLQWLFKQFETLENQIKRALDHYSSQHPVGEWMKEITGIGPVISAGLLAHINIELCNTASRIWRYAGLDPTVRWPNEREVKEALDRHNVPKQIPLDLAGQIGMEFGRNPDLLIPRLREEHGETVTPTALMKALKKLPWNAELKTLTAFKLGESFVKVSGNPKDIYGKIYLSRKAYEQRKNEAGDYADQAAAGAARVGKNTEAYKHYSQGRLPPGHIHARARRYAVKIFLSHLHHVWYEMHHGSPPPAPYAMTHLGHTDYIPPPNW